MSTLTASPTPDSPPSSISSSSSSSLSGTFSSSEHPRPRVDALKGFLDRVLRIHCSDGRVFIGTFVCTDKALNIVLSNTEEYRIGMCGDGRYVTMVMIPWRLVVNVAIFNDQYT